MIKSIRRSLSVNLTEPLANWERFYLAPDADWVKLKRMTTVRR